MRTAVAKRTKGAKDEAEKGAIRSLKKEVKEMKKDIRYIKRILENPVNAMMVMSGQAKPGEKVVTSVGIGIGCARWLRDEGRTDELLDAGMTQEEIDQLDEDFEHEPEDD